MTTSSFFICRRYLWLALLGVGLLLPYTILRMFAPEEIDKLGAEHPLLATLSGYGFWVGAGVTAYVGVKTHGGSDKL